MRKRRRFTQEFKATVVLEVLTGAQFPPEACRKHALSPNLLGLWKAAFLERAHTLFQPDEQREEDQARIAELEQLLGRATCQIEISKKSLDAAGCGLDQKRDIINILKDEYLMRLLCETLGMHRCNVYHQPRPDEDRQVKDALKGQAGA